MKSRRTTAQPLQEAPTGPPEPENLPGWVWALVAVATLALVIVVVVAEVAPSFG